MTNNIYVLQIDGTPVLRGTRARLVDYVTSLSSDPDYTITPSRGDGKGFCEQCGHALQNSAAGPLCRNCQNANRREATVPLD